MRPELRVLPGGRARRPIDTSNIVYLEDSRHGIQPPSVIEICDVLVPRLPDVGGLYGRALAVFLEMTGERWLRSRTNVGLRVSLAAPPEAAPRRKKDRVVLTVPATEWTLTVRALGPRREHYHLLLPSEVVPGRTEVSFFWLSDGGAVHHVVVFEPSDHGWRPVAHYRDPALVRFESRDRNTAS